MLYTGKEELLSHTQMDRRRYSVRSVYETKIKEPLLKFGHLPVRAFEMLLRRADGPRTDS